MNHHGELPVMVVIRAGKKTRINVTDYDELTDTIPGAVDPPTAEVPESSAPTESSASIIPENWQQLSWPQLRRLAARISETPINGRDDAVNAITRYLESE